MELNGDGLIENLYHYLWSKDSLFNRNPQVFIPDTVVYSYEKPVFWYFTSKSKTFDGPLFNADLDNNSVSEGLSTLTSNTETRIMRKSRKNLHNKEIERVFLKDAP